MSKLLRCESHKPALELAVKILESYEKLKQDKDSLDNISEHITECFDEMLCFCRMTTGVWLDEPGAYDSTRDDVWALWSEEASKLN